MGFVPRLGVEQYAVASGLRRSDRHGRHGWHPRDPAALADGHVHRQDGGARVALPGLSHPVNFQDGSIIEIGVNPNVEDIRDAVHHQHAHAACSVDPGRYEFHEYFVFWNTNSCGARSRSAAGTRSASSTTATDAATRFGPAFRLNENFNASVELQVNDIDLPTGSFVSKLVTTPRELQLQHEDVLQRAAAVQHRHASVESNLRFNVIHRPLSDFFLVYNERRDERTGELLTVR